MYCYCGHGGLASENVAAMDDERQPGPLMGQTRQPDSHSKPCWGYTPRVVKKQTHVRSSCGAEHGAPPVLLGAGLGLSAGFISKTWGSSNPSVTIRQSTGQSRLPSLLVIFQED